MILFLCIFLELEAPNGGHFHLASHEYHTTHRENPRMNQILKRRK